KVSGLSYFQFGQHASNPGLLQLADQKDYYEASRRASDKDFLVVPWEEPSAYFGGHYNIIWPKDVYWTKVRQPGQPFVEEVPGYGKVYHTGSAADVQAMMDAEGAYWYHAHPRTKSTTGYPDLIWDKPYVKNDRYLGVAFKPGSGRQSGQDRERRGRGQSANDDRRCRLDVSAELRRSRVERRQESRSPGDFGHRFGAVRDEALRDPVRCHGQSVGATCRMGLGRRRRIRAAGVGVAESRRDDELQITRCRRHENVVWWH